MLDFSNLTLFVIASLALIVAPGPAVLYIVTKSIDQGRRAGIASVLGISAGTLVHIGAAALGISAILTTSATAFAVVKYLGAAYLIYLGIQKLRSPEALTKHQVGHERSLMAVFRQGIVVNILNPKGAIFFLAFLPQFIDPAKGPAWSQIVGLGLIFMSLALVSDGSYALVAGQIGNWLRSHRKFLGAQRYVSGGTYIALGLVAASAGEGRK